VVKLEWGTKRICPNCGTRYYDLRRDPIVCPKCGAGFDPEALLKTRRTRVAAPVVEEVVEAVAEEEIDSDLATEEVVEGEEGEGTLPIEGGEEAEEEEEEEEEEEVIEDASELGEDEDDMAEVIENVEDEEEG